MKGVYIPKKRTLKFMFDEKQPERMCLRNVTFKEVGGMKNVKVNKNYERYVEKSQHAYDIVRSLLCPKDQIGFEELTNKTRRSTATLQAQFDGINKYVDEYQKMPKKDSFLNENIWNLTKAHFRKILTSDGKIKPLSMDYVTQHSMEMLSEPGASAGYPYICDGPVKKRDVVETPEFLMELVQMMLVIPRDSHDNELYYRQFSYPCVCYQKTAVCKPGKEEKVRFIWGYPLLMTMLEGLFSIPLIEKCKELEKKNTSMFTSFTLQPYSQEYIKLQQRYSNAMALVIDYSTYDSTVPSWVIKDAFELIEEMFSLSKDEQAIFKAVQHYFIHTPIILSSGTLFVKHHGIPSGSWFTNIVGSLCNAMMMMYINILARRKPVVMKTMGDDNLSIGGRFDVGKFSGILKQTFGVNVNPSKCYVGTLTGAKYLGRRFSLSEKAFKGWKKNKTDSLISFIYPGKKDNDVRMWQRLFALYLDNPCTLLWHLVDSNKEEIKSAFSEAFDVDSNRETVFTVFHGDYKFAKEFLKENSVERLMVPPRILDKNLGASEPG